MTTFADQARKMTTENLNSSLRNCERGMDTTGDMGQWAQLAGKAQAFRVELERRHRHGWEYDEARSERDIIGDREDFHAD